MSRREIKKEGRKRQGHKIGEERVKRGFVRKIWSQKEKERKKRKEKIKEDNEEDLTRDRKEGGKQNNYLVESKRGLMRQI